MENSTVKLTLREYDELKQAYTIKDWEYMWEINEYDSEVYNRKKTLFFCTKDEAFLAMNSRNQELELIVYKQREEIESLKKETGTHKRKWWKW